MAGGDPAIAPEAAEWIAEIEEMGSSAALHRALRSVPRDLRLLVGTGLLRVDDLGELYRGWGVTSSAELVALVDAGELDVWLHARPDGGQALLAAFTQGRPPHTRVSLGRAYSVARRVVRALEGEAPHAQVLVSGSLRRFDATVGDIVLLASGIEADQTVAILRSLGVASAVRHVSRHKASVIVGDEQVDLRIVENARQGAIWLHTTGSRAHLAGLRNRAVARGLVLTPDGVFENDRALAADSEEAIYTALGLAFVPPELREGRGELEAAAEGRLPALVSPRHIRGDLHMHTDWSDGRDTAERMLTAARELGYEYAAITDHSPSAGALRTLTIDRLQRQMEEIARLREQISGLTILHGAEVDILPDGRLDFPDRLLERLDLVLASLHDAAGHDPKRLTDRYLAAIRHPLVTIITHPTNRLVGRRGPYELDYDAVFAAAAETGTAIEIDGAPGHLDLDGEMARRAIAAGVTVAIDSDCHYADRLRRQMLFGVSTARRGWVEPRHVLNTRPIEEVRAFVAAKRRRR